MKHALPFPARPLRPDATGAVTSIDDRVRALEQRMAAREIVWMAQVSALGQRLRAATRARRVVPPLLGLGIALGVLGWLLRGRTGPHSATTSASPATRVGGAAVPWAQWLALAWPLLPAAWRSRVSLATAATLVNVVIPLAQRLWARPRRRRRAEAVGPLGPSHASARQ